MSYTQEKEFNCETPKEAMEHNDDLGYECRFERSGLAKPKSEKSLKKKQDRFCSNYGVSSFPAINVDIGKGAYSMKGQVCDVKTVQGHNHHGSTIQFQNQPARKIAKLDRQYLMRNFPVSYFENVDILFKIIGKKKKFIKDTFKTQKKEKSKENVMSLDHKDSKKQSPELMPVQKHSYKEKIMKIKPGKVQIKQDQTIEEPMKRNTHKYKQIMTITQHHDAKQANRSMEKVFSERKQRRQEQKQQSYQEKIRDITDNRNTIHSHAKSAEKFRIKHVQAETKGNSPDEFIKVIAGNPDNINIAKEKRVPVQKRNIKLNTQIAFHRQKRREANKSKTNLLEEKKVQQLQPQIIQIMEKQQVNNYRRSEEVSQRLYPNNRTLNSQHTDGNGVHVKEVARPVNDYFENENQTEEEFDEDDKKTIKIGDDPESESEAKPTFSKPVTAKGKNSQIRIIKKEKSSERSKKNFPINMKKEEKKHQDYQITSKNVKKVSRSPTSTNNYVSQQNRQINKDIKVETKRSAQIKISENNQSPSQKPQVQSVFDHFEANLLPQQEIKKEPQQKCEFKPQEEEPKQPANSESFTPINVSNDNQALTQLSSTKICPFPVTIGTESATEDISFLQSAIQPKQEAQIMQQNPIEQAEGVKGSLVEVEDIRSSSSFQSEKQEDLKKTPRFHVGKESNNAKRKRSTKRFDLIRSSEEATIVQYEPQDPANSVNPVEQAEKTHVEPIVKAEVAYDNLYDTFSPANHTFVHKATQKQHHQRQRTYQQCKIPQRSQRTYSNIDSEEINNFYDEIVQLGVNETHQYHPKLGRKSNISEGKLKELQEYENLQKMRQEPIARVQSNQQSQPNSMHSIDKAIMLYTESDNLINNSCEPNLAFPHLSKKPSSKISIFSSNSEAQKVPQNHTGKKKPTTIFEQQEEHLMNQTKPMMNQTKPTNLNSSLICIDLNQNANVPLAQPVILEAERSVFQDENQILATTETKQYNEDYIVSVNKIKQNAQERQQRKSAENERIESSSACMKIPSNNQRSKETSVVGSVSQISLLHLESQEEAQINKHLETLKKSPSRCSEVEEKSSSSQSEAKEKDQQETPQQKIAQQQKCQTNNFIATDKSFADEDIIKNRGSQVIVNSNSKLSDKIIENMKGSKSMKRLSLACGQTMNKIQPLKSAKSIHNMINQGQQEHQVDIPVQNPSKNKKEQDVSESDVPIKIQQTYSQVVSQVVEKNLQGELCKEDNSVKYKEPSRQHLMQIIQEKQPIKQNDQESFEDYSAKEEQTLQKLEQTIVNEANLVEQCPSHQMDKVHNTIIEQQQQQPASIHSLHDLEDKTGQNSSQKASRVEKSPEEACPSHQNFVLNVQQQQKILDTQSKIEKNQQKIEEALVLPQTDQTDVNKNSNQQVIPAKDHIQKIKQRNNQEQVKEQAVKQQKRNVKNNIKMHKMFQINIVNQFGTSYHMPPQNVQPVLQSNDFLRENETKGQRKSSVKLAQAGKVASKEVENRSSAKILSQQIINQSEVKVQKSNYIQPEKQNQMLQIHTQEQNVDKHCPTILPVSPKVEEVPPKQQDQIEMNCKHQEEARQYSKTYIQQLTSNIQSKIVVGQDLEEKLPKESEKIVAAKINQPTESPIQQHFKVEQCELKQQKQEKLIENIQKLKQPICVLEEQYFFSEESQKSQQQSQQNFSALPLLQSNSSLPKSNTQRSSLQKVKLMLEDPSQIKPEEQQVQVSKKDFSTNTNDLLANYQEKIEESMSSMSKLAEISNYIIDFDKEILLLKKSGQFSFNQEIWSMILKIFTFLDAKNAYLDRLIDQKSVWLFNCLQKQSKFHRYAMSNAQNSSQQNIKEALKQLVIKLSRKVEIDQKNIKFFIETLTGMPVLLLKETCYHKLDNLYRHSNIFGFTFGKGQVWRIVGTLLNKKNQQQKRLRLEKLSNNQIIEITWKKFLEEFKYSFIAGFSDKYHLRTFKVASNARKNEEKPSFKLTVNDQSNSGKKVHCLMGITSHKELAKEVNGKMLVYGKTQSQKKGEQCYKYLGSGDIGLVSMKLKKGEYIIVLQIQQKSSISQLQILMGSESPQVTLKHEKT